MLCEKCSSIHLKERPGTSLIKHIHQDSFSALQQSKATCHFCRKIWIGLCRSRAQQEASDKFDPASPVLLAIHFPERTYLEGSEQFSREQRIYLEDVYASCSYLQAKLYFVENIPDSVHAYLEKLSLTNDSDKTTLSSSNVELARVWLQHCRSNHQPCKQFARPGPSPLRIIDISDPETPFLVMGGGRNLVYATLSYKWGSSKKYLTTSQNISHHQQRIPLNKLPRTFKEAIPFARALGFFYFWIDALCIQHDIEVELNDQIELMGEIYSSSALTIFAAAGDNSNHGLQAHRDGASTKPSVVRLKATKRDWHYEAQFHVSLYESVYPKFKKRSPLTKRGWVLQEEALSARGLWFGRDKISWTCLCENATESSPGMTAVERIDEAKLQASDAEVVFLMKMRYRLREGSRQIGGQEMITISGRDRVEDEWYKLVENFTARELTNISDVLPALAGIASRISKIYGIHYIAGLWVEDLQLGLLWQNDTHLDFREVSGPQDATSGPQPAANDPEKIDEWVAVPSPEDDWGKDSSIGRASFSWISHYMSGRKVTFDHYRKYILQTHLGIQILEVKVSPNPKFRNPFGDILSASLKVRARVKKARLAYDDVILSKHGEYRLTNADDSAFSENYVAEFYPDSPDTVEQYSIIHCVLCAVAWYQSNDSEDRGKGILNCIGVVPASTPERSNQFVRIGLVKVLDETWFKGCPWSRLDDRSEVQEFELV